MNFECWMFDLGSYYGVCLSLKIKRQYTGTCLIAVVQCVLVVGFFMCFRNMKKESVIK